MRFVWGIMWIVIGILLMKFTFPLVQTFGRISWAEEHLGGGLGGTFTLYKLVAVIIIILGMLYMFGGIDFLVKPLLPTFGGTT